ncbi:hypothetical protein [Dyadobacter luticola]|uniref:AlgX/AlgJ SGNH hydrolase-like domain-containing protein n=1 Tax=Dyadobacter luticola TaxID=1979387 RepID=A0A5R9KY29_9BACT|nr:hypothetical protein [Dyadobacter luticola]TLV01222.1 hypothetical protein FEN17_17390 [Dyadobacter luticola]
MKFLKYAFLVLGCIVWAVGLSPALFSKTIGWGISSDGYEYGDLYRLSNLSKFKDPRKFCTGYTPPAKAAHSKKVHLFIIGDSFTEEQRVDKKDFAVDSYTHIKWNNILHVKLDTTETNILLVESVERHFREKMVGPITNFVADTATFVQTYGQDRFVTKLDDAFRTTSVNDRLDGLLFQNAFFLGLKQRKADFTSNLFNRVNTSTTMVNDGRDLVYFMDTDTSITSSFHELADTEVDSIVKNINKSRDLAMSIGFDQVILSVIPNKVSVVDPGYDTYNHLIERVYRHPGLHVPVIDVLPEYQKMGSSAYLKGDSHWTCEGQSIWLDKVNRLINVLVGQPRL